MSLTEIIRAVKELSESDRAKVAEALSLYSGLERTDDAAERQAELHRHLLDTGFLKSIPDRTLPRREFKRIKIKGKPLSETIIEERR